MEREITSSNYQLWQPVYRQSGSEVRCSFDVTSPEARGINEGDAELFAGFLATMDVCAGDVKSWTVQRFASPYYAYDPARDDEGDLFGLAWRVTLSITGVTGYRACGKTGPYSADGFDPTWVDGPAGLTGEEERCVLIAAEGPTREFSLRDSYGGGELELIEYAFPHRTVLQARLDLGVVNLRGSVGPVRELLHESKIRFMTTHESDAFQRSAWQQPAEWRSL
ncbi:hypothetical protein HII36_35500 [Nonomuraea sp. NN258]|uniref:hypothetical protein n=1 Tax=Nonomuraea antri TaxID=2730852 RepID=UPI0015694342|nr:hypothetical protein [Nonomuraea antri]NRQ37104.1 hypothetical protein [Nonomuraea antri]